MTAERSLRPVESAPIATPDLFSDDRIRLIKQQVANGAPDNLFAAMIEIARTRGLDPLAKQISLINFGGTWQITTTIDGYRALAEQTGAYAGSDAAVFTHTDDPNKPHTASVTVWKLVGGQRVPFTATVYYAEYMGRAPIWREKPFTMLSKVAESHALRKAFPSTLSGMYTPDEMAQAGPVITSADIKDAYRAPDVTVLPHSEILDHETGEIIEQPAPVDDEAAKQRQQTALSSVFKIGTDKGLERDDVKAIAYHKYTVDSMTKLTIENLRDYYRFLNQSDEFGLQFELSQARAAMADDATFEEVEG